MDAGRTAYPDASPDVARPLLRRAVKQLNERGLYVASKWAAELLTSLPRSPSPSTSQVRRTSQRRSASPHTQSQFSTSTPARSGPNSVSTTPLTIPPFLPASGSSVGPSAHSTPPFPHLSVDPFLEPVSTVGRSGGTAFEKGGVHDESRQKMEERTKEEEAWDEEEEDVYLVGKAYFDNHELDRAAHVLKDCQGGRGWFLGLYAKFLASERRLQEAAGPVGGPKDLGKGVNWQLLPVLADLEDVADPFLFFLKGMLLARLHRRVEAIDAFVRSLSVMPYNWSCWLELSKAVEDEDEVRAGLRPLLPDSFMTDIFLVYTALDLQSNSESVAQTVDSLLEYFPDNGHLKAQKALASYQSRDFFEAERQFDQILAKDPFRVDDIDTFSNILYVMENRPKLSQLAHTFARIDRNRPETCCLIGNYYSLRSEHEKAIVYFRQALRLDRNYLSAWTLMGHEYVELKNSHAAIEAYRRAVDVNRKDYRAWYGLGQTYELLGMHYYSLNYYQRAVALRPFDKRMWHALGDVYEKLEHWPDAIKCAERALACGPHMPDDTTEREKLKLLIETYRARGGDVVGGAGEGDMSVG